MLESYRSRRFAIAALALPALLLSGCAGLERNDIAQPVDGTELSDKLQPYIYYEEGGTLFLAVDMRAAQYVKEGSIYPVGIGLANLGREKLTFLKEAFVIEAADGTRYPTVGVEEYRRDYKRSPTDERLSQTFQEILQTRFQSYSDTSWRPFPVSGEAAATQTQVELPRNFWTRAYLYFPVPKSGIHGESLTLVVGPDGVDEQFIVKFEVP